MVETLERFIEQALDHPRHTRAALYRELLRSEAFIVNLGQAAGDAPQRPSRNTDGTFEIWADRDPETGGVWVPVFPARDTVVDFVTERGLEAPPGKDFFWMEFSAGKIFTLLKGVDCFAGLSFHLDPNRALPVPWPIVKVLAEGRVPADDPAVYDMPLRGLSFPKGLPAVEGRIASGGVSGPLFCLPDAGHFGPEDLRRLVRIDWGREGRALVPCRHFLQILRYLKSTGHLDSWDYYDDVLRSLMGFEMYGEAEAFCEWLALQGNEKYAWLHLGEIYRLTGRLTECAALCRRAWGRYPDEKAFAALEIRALMDSGELEQARRRLTEACRSFPGDPILSQFSVLAVQN